jgi:hypothetical protein
MAFALPSGFRPASSNRRWMPIFYKFHENALKQGTGSVCHTAISISGLDSVDAWV